MRPPNTPILSEKALSSTSKSEEAWLSPGERRLLLEEIAQIGLVLGRDLLLDQAPVALSPQSVLSGTTDSNVTPLERIHVLEAIWPALQKALAAIVSHPDTALIRVSLPIPLEQLRGEPSAARTIASTPKGQLAWRVLQHQSSPSPHPLPEIRSQVSLVTEANRFVVTLLRQLEAEAEALTRLARFCEEEREAQRAEAVMVAAKRWRNTTFLRNLAPLLPAEYHRVCRAENLVRCRPPYRTLFGLWRTLQQPLGFDWTHSPLLQLPALELWHLYEIWCFFKTAETLQALGYRLVTGDAIRWEANGLRLMLVRGRRSCLRFLPPAQHSKPKPKNSPPQAMSDSLELCYQPYFPSANQTPQATFFSRTHAMQPDIALQQRESFLLLDPKFRTYTTPGTEQDDINKMHAYRDAIRQRATDTLPEKMVVEVAWCLFPGEEEADHRCIAYPMPTPNTPFGTAGIGAICLRPGRGNALLKHLLLSFCHEKQENLA